MPGKKSKGNNTAMKVKKKPVIGEMLKLMNLNMKKVDYCTQTGKQLPRNGMVVRWNGNLFVNRAAAEAYEREHTS